jgi:hypothetical protein
MAGVGWPYVADTIYSTIRRQVGALHCWSWYYQRQVDSSPPFWWLSDRLASSDSGLLLLDIWSLDLVLFSRLSQGRWARRS